ncbi:MAG TPA: GNAT family N-acetyltransferase, partial [Rubricoccaceae bacterium]
MSARLPAPPAGPDPFASGLPVLDGVPRPGQTPHVRLRPPRLDDADDLFAVFSDLETLRYWSHEPLTEIAQAHHYIAGAERLLAERTLFQWAVAESETDRLVGTVTLLAWDRAHRRAEIGFILHRGVWGRGLASEAVRAALAFAFGPMGLHRVEADVDP